jgi:SAM-dependent MidA family methyltransferase
VAQLIKKQKGALIAIDYGYAQPDGSPTLQAVKGHAYTDVLKDPGKVDLTALVDFASLRRAALLQEVTVTGPVGQGDFLGTLGMELRAAQLKQHATPEQATAIDSAYQRLTDPTQMGSLFKVLAATSLPPEQIPGF